MERKQQPKFEISPEKVYTKQELFDLIGKFIAQYGQDAERSVQDQLRDIFENYEVYLNYANEELSFNITSYSVLFKNNEKNCEGTEIILLYIYILFVDMTEKAYELVKKHNEIFKNQTHNNLSTKEKACKALTEKLNINGDFMLECLHQLNASIDKNKEYMIQIPEEDNKIYCFPLMFLNMTEEEFKESPELPN